MTDNSEIVKIRATRVSCDGSGEVPAALGHPKVWLEIDDKGYVECGYCDRKFIFIGGPADKG
jgi:NADH dehydrogenase (ubiquinone) Fe-S protein 6